MSANVRREASSFVLGGGAILAVAATIAVGSIARESVGEFGLDNISATGIGIACALFPLIGGAETALRIAERRPSRGAAVLTVVSYLAVAAIILGSYADWYLRTAYGRPLLAIQAGIAVATLAAQVGGLLIVASRLRGGTRS